MLILLTTCSCSDKPQQAEIKKPNVLVIIGDQWRAQAFGHRGNPDVKTPHFDQLAADGVEFVNAVSRLPVCTPTRATLMTGQRPLTHGVFMNDIQLDTGAVTIAKVMGAKGYRTGMIGKWHIDGRGRSTYIPKSRRQGFEYWKALECTHNYNHSLYYANTPDTLMWEGYDAIAQTKDAISFLKEASGSANPFLLYLSWGPPHAPYLTAPEEYRKRYVPDSLYLRKNVPADLEDKVRKDLAGYYAHCTALDDMLGLLRETLAANGMDKNTIIVFTSDHGDLLGSHHAYKKQQPYEESIRVPMTFYVPKELGGRSSQSPAMINTEDIMPTILGLTHTDIPNTVEGLDYSSYIKGGDNPGDTVAVISCIQPFGQWNRTIGGKEYRGLRSTRFTYARDLNGPWLFFDNEQDPFQLNNLVDHPQFASLMASFDQLLSKKLEKEGDEFLPGLDYVKRWNYPELDDRETVPYTN